MNVLKLLSDAKTIWQQHRKAWVIFFDLKSAFDTVNHKLLFKKVGDRHLPEDWIATCRRLYKDIRING